MEIWETDKLSTIHFPGEKPNIKTRINVKHYLFNIN
jgi:hypothetical protein